MKDKKSIKSGSTSSGQIMVVSAPCQRAVRSCAETCNCGFADDQNPVRPVLLCQVIQIKYDLR